MTRTMIVTLATLLLLGFTVAPGPAAEAKNPYLRPDESWIRISGTAVDARETAFTLDYGSGTVLVEMDEWHWRENETKAFEGDRVTVYGRIDDDFFEKTKIEAASVYDQNKGTYYYASADDEEYGDDRHDYWGLYNPVVVGQVIVRGTVTGIQEREFTIDRGRRMLTIDTIHMDHNPLDDKGYQRVDKGDYVTVAGEMDFDVWEKRELMADNVTILDQK